MKKIAIIGAGGFGREVKTIIDAINNIKDTFHFIGYFDDGFEKNKTINGYPVLGGIEDLISIKEQISVVVAIGNPIVKKKLVQQLITNPNLDFPNIISPRSEISNDFVDMGKGNIICSGSIITCNIKLKDFIILNLMCTVGHDTTIESYSSFMPSVNISGEVLIGEGVYIGTGAKIINQLEIGEYSIIGAGAVVAKSIPPKCTAVGVPAKPIKYH